MRDSNGRFVKGHKTWNKGKKGLQSHTSEWKEDMCKRNSGKNNPFSGRKHSQKTIEILRQRSKDGWKNPDYVKKQIKSRIHGPSCLEKQLMKLLKEANFPYKYCGKGDVIIGFKNPDFINTNGQKKIIEVFGNYWHNPALREGVKYHQTEEGTKETYKEYGFSTCVIWEDEFNDEESLLDKIFAFEVAH